MEYESLPAKFNDPSFKKIGNKRHTYNNHQVVKNQQTGNTIVI